MNIYEKLAQARVDLQKRNLQKSGHNKFAGYDYFELRDFLPAINEIMAEHKLLGVCSFEEDEATLEIIDAEEPDERILLSSPMSTAELKGCHPVQNLGAVQTYLRRYLYTAAFEIVEGDALDATQGKDEDPLGTGNVKHLPARTKETVCAGCGAVLNAAQTTLAKKYAEKHNGWLLCADCRAKEDNNA